MSLRAVPYTPPSWAKQLLAPSYGRLPLARLPTPVVPWACPELADLNVDWWIKRDDLTGSEAAGNKARKLEFLAAEAVAQGCDSLVTIGGLQSNHCRATAAAARLAGLEPHLVLLVRDREIDSEVGLGGNLLVERLLGAKLHLCAAKRYVRYGADMSAMERLNTEAADELRRQGKNPYVVPVGGTTPLGTWGYLAAVEELRLQQRASQRAATSAPVSAAVPSFDHIVVACGSGGTAAGLALGKQLSGLGGELHAVNVQHTPELFYERIQHEASQLATDRSELDTLGSSREWLTIHDGGRLGYGNADRRELESILRVGTASGVLLDHVYTGKALFHFCEHARSNPSHFRGKRILFWHTGGLPGLAAKEAELLGLLEQPGRLHERE